MQTSRTDLRRVPRDDINDFHTRPGRLKVRYGSMLMDSGESERGVKLLGEAREELTAIKYESGVQ